MNSEDWDDPASAGVLVLETLGGAVLGLAVSVGLIIYAAWRRLTS